MMALIKTRSPGIAMPKSSPAHKEKKTFSLSRQSVMFLEALRKERRSRSMSSVLEDLIRQQQQAKEMERISASVTRYYDSLTSEEIAEDSAWGDFAATQFPSED
jgi:Tfp pilus assembly protein PilO